MSWIWSASSSTISASRSAEQVSGGRRSRTYARQSGMTEPGHLVERLEERLPSAALRRQGLSAGRRDPVEPAPALACLFHPSALDEALALDSIEQRIQRGNLEGDLSVRTLLDQLRDLVAVPLPFLDEREHEHLGASLLQALRVDMFGRHM